jgi:hypothetical protein
MKAVVFDEGFHIIRFQELVIFLASIARIGQGFFIFLEFRKMFSSNLALCFSTDLRHTKV